MSKLVSLSDYWKKSDCEYVIASLKREIAYVAYKSPNLSVADKIAKLNELDAEVYKKIGEAKVFKSRIKARNNFMGKVGKAFKVAGQVLFLIDVAQDSWAAHQQFCQTVAALETMENNIYILDCLIASSDNTYLRMAASDLKLYLNDSLSEDLSQTIMALDQAAGVITGAALEVLHMQIAAAGVPGAIIELVRTFGNLVFNLDEISQAAAETVALSASADILAQNYLAHLEEGYAIHSGDLWIAYSSYSHEIYTCLLNLAELRKEAEMKMAEWQDDQTILNNCESNINRCSSVIGEYSWNYYSLFLK